MDKGKAKKIIGMLREMSRNGGMTWIAVGGRAEKVDKSDIDALLEVVEAVREHEKEAVCG